MSIGKKLRLKRWAGAEFEVLLPIDHGLTLGPIRGMSRISELAPTLDHPAISGIVAHKGMAERLIERDLISTQSLLIHVNGMSSIAPNPDTKTMLTEVEAAIRMGADGISLQINFDGTNDAHNLSILGAIVDESSKYSLPVLTMLYDKVQSNPAQALQRYRHLIRIAMELGSDAVKLGAPANLEALPSLIEGLSEDIQIFFAGGALCSDEELIALSSLAHRSGARGLCMGRNLFQRENPGHLLDRLQGFHPLSSRDYPLLAQGSEN